MFVTGLNAKILKGRGKGKVGVITSCDAVGNVVILAEGKEYGPMPDWGDYEILDEEYKRHLESYLESMLYDTIFKAIGKGSRRGYEYAMKELEKGVMVIMPDDKNKLNKLREKLEETSLFVRELEGELHCSL